MDNKDLKARTKNFALQVIRMAASLPKGKTCDILSKQLLRSATSLGANYRAACRAKSTADFLSKMSKVEEEADQSIFWMELLVESGVADGKMIQQLLNEATELLAIVVASINTVKSRVKKQIQK